MLVSKQVHIEDESDLGVVAIWGLVGKSYHAMKIVFEGKTKTYKDGYFGHEEK